MAESRRFSEVAGNWRAIRRLLPVYAHLAEQFHLAEPPVRDVRELRGNDQEMIDGMAQWMDMIDDNAEAHHFRQVLQSSALDSPEDKLAALIHRFLAKDDTRTRDKLDFCLTQYLAVCAPPLLYQVEPSLEEVAQVLQPVLGAHGAEVPAWLEPLEKLIQELRDCQGLKQLEERKIIENGRQLKKMAREKHATASILAAFTRFNFLVRQNTYRLLQADIRIIEKLLAQLEERRVETLDCAALGLTTEESLASLRQLCENWKRPSVTEYTQFQFGRLLQLRSVLERALAAAMPEETGRVRQLASQVEALSDEVAELRNAMVALQSRVECAESALTFRSSESSNDWAEQKNTWVETIGYVDVKPAAEAASRAVEESEPLEIEVLNPPLEPAHAAPVAPASAPANGNGVAPEPAASGAMPDEVLIEAIAEILPQLRSAKLRNRHMPTLQVAGTAMLLNPAEMQALMEPSLDGDGMRAVVGAKILLISSMQQRNFGMMDRALQHSSKVLGRAQAVASRHRGTTEVAEARTAALKQLRFLMQRAQEANRLAASGGK